MAKQFSCWAPGFGIGGARQSPPFRGEGIVYAQFAIDGKLDFEAGEAMRKLMQPDKQWFAMWGNVTRAWLWVGSGRAVFSKLKLPLALVQNA